MDGDGRSRISLGAEPNGGTYAYQSNQLDFTNYQLPATNFVNLRLGVDLRRMGVNIYVRNLTNKQYFVGDASGYFPGFPPFQPVINAPREIGVMFSQKF